MNQVKTYVNEREREREREDRDEKTTIKWSLLKNEVDPCCCCPTNPTAFNPTNWFFFYGAKVG